MAISEPRAELTTAEWIQANRQRLALSLIRLARLVEVNPARIGEWERGRSLPSPDAMRRLEEVFAHGSAETLETPLPTLAPRTHVWLDDRGVAWIDDTNTKVKEVVLDRTACGWTPEEIREQHPYLTLAQIHAALAYYYDHQETVDEQLAEDERFVEKLRAEAGESPFVRRMRAEGRLP